MHFLWMLKDKWSIERLSIERAHTKYIVHLQVVTTFKLAEKVKNQNYRLSMYLWIN